eukprot:CAMPEP_0170624294 /NCGR_PEP_ID=MMETSP0224-20130122/30155_1 /TAXON_ID=285029 /ORGANISM="Togula jolla, Strain CCCM 725" /LENGTH=263 /DNA_ID=CAMNT_0010950805 /DNA_START=35 /DNA_END=826 /DNA_ORIENTATION=+
MASLELPPEILAASTAMLAAPLYVPTPSLTQQAVVVTRVGHWVVAEDDLGVFYQNVHTLESHDVPPPELVALLQKKRQTEEQQLRQQRLKPLLQQQQKQQQEEERMQRHQMQMELRKKWEQQYGQQGPNATSLDIQPTQSAAMKLQSNQPNPLKIQPNPFEPLKIPPHQSAPVPASQETVVKMRVAHWAIAQDKLGEFYQNMITGESFDDPPADLLRILVSRVGPTPLQANLNQNMPTWNDLASKAQPQYRSWSYDADVLLSV